MRILIPLVGTFSKEGGWRVLSELANSWLRLGHEVIFLSHKKFIQPYFPTDAKIIFYDNSGNICKEGEKNYRMPVGGPFILRLLLKKALDKLEADVILATQHFTVDPIVKSRIKGKKFYYVQAYEPEFYENGPLRYRVYKKIAENSYKKGLKTIVNSLMYRDYKEIKSDMVIYPGLNLNIFKPEIDTAVKDKFIIGSIGRKEIFKGTSYIIDAFKILREEFGEAIELHLAFGNPDWSLIDGIKMFYPNGDKELADFYRSLNCYVCAQYVQLDAVHYPVIETMACGIPLITTGYYPSTDDNAWKILVKNSEDIALKVKDLMSNPFEAEKKAQLAVTSVKEFDQNILAKQMINYFEE